jgi:Holliday junction resolvasome RuvABC endonuclease subunit
MRFTIGVDVGKFSLFLSVLDEKSNIYLQHEINNNEKKDIERGHQMMLAVEDCLIEFLDTQEITADDVTLAIEEPLYLNNIKVSFALDRSVIACEMGALNVGVHCFSYANTTWKKSILGRGNASKEDIAKWAEVKWKKHSFGVQDFKDAACLALHQHILLYGGVPQVIPKIKVPTLKKEKLALIKKKKGVK